jgi:hypothetical protein
LPDQTVPGGASRTSLAGNTTVLGPEAITLRAAFTDPPINTVYDSYKALMKMSKEFVACNSNTVVNYPVGIGVPAWMGQPRLLVVPTHDPGVTFTLPMRAVWSALVDRGCNHIEICSEGLEEYYPMLHDASDKGKTCRPERDAVVHRFAAGRREEETPDRGPPSPTGLRFDHGW